MSGPLPSTLVLLAELPNCVPGRKVRFLGCVDEYRVQDATLKLKHNYPVSTPPKIANVNVEHVLENIKRKDLEVGAWVNVIGYTERRKERGVFVQAIAIWNAGNVDLSAYQRAVEARKDQST